MSSCPSENPENSVSRCSSHRWPFGRCGVLAIPTAQWSRLEIGSMAGWSGRCLWPKHPRSRLLSGALLIGSIFILGSYWSHGFRYQQSTRLYQVSSLLNGRSDVVTVTPWMAPVVWESTFDPKLLDCIYKPLNITIATTVFAVGKYTRFLKDFLETAEQHYFVGYRVNFYIFTDRPQEVPSVKMAAERQVVVLPAPTLDRWQDISAGRMGIIQTAIEERLRHNADYIFCLDVDSKFHGHWGVETLGGLVAVVHPGYWDGGRDRFPYERRPVSRAYIPADEGDFYYCGGAFGGLLANVHAMAKTCRQRFEEDAAEGVEAAWQEESHLNRYLVSHKPTKLLSPEYLWQDNKRPDHAIRLVRFSAIDKNNDEVRPNQ